MAEVGELVRKAVDLNERGHSVEAFVGAAVAFEMTVASATGETEPRLQDLKKVVNEHWPLLGFLCFPALDSPYLGFRFIIREISLNPRRTYSIKEIAVYLISYALRHERIPENIGFTSGAEFEAKDGTLLVPVSVVSGLLSFVVVHPANKNAEIPEKYWISIADFKMFVSELWGRIDLAERVRKFYLTR